MEGTFVTVSAIKVDGKTVEGFEKQTIDISAYHDGETKLIYSDMVEASSYNSVSLEIDYESDASGNSPGCYVLTSDNQKHNLQTSSSTSSELSFSKDFEVQSNENSSLVFDFDLRKTIQRNENSAETQYSFVAASEMASGVRVISENSTGEIEGNVTGSAISDDKEYIVYAYKKGEYNASTETQGQTGSNLLFMNAVTSSKVKQDGSYKLSFLEEGDYEIHVASYNRTSTESELSFSAIANAVSAVNNIILSNITVSSNTTIQLDLTVSLSI
ncbi:DUF4382 domain-containing protein [Draconibacterium halophilum]|uniref:DUF4382 domain-containing protein n=1 Tax=Draconibacterium halophilum TaxID=2706887 RepID=UPI0021D17A3B|nr:DUF4382 domain-containing protein [Draconibacterium halophilum]